MTRVKPPKHLKGTGAGGFEELILKAAGSADFRKECRLCRYGVQASMGRPVDLPLHTTMLLDQGAISVEDARAIDKFLREPQWRPQRSLPDFSGTLAPHGRTVVIEAKVVTGSAFELRDEKFKRRQLTHLLERAEMGAVSAIAIHYNEVRLVKTVHGAGTVLFPVHPQHPFWVEYANNSDSKRSINRDDCHEWAVSVRWVIPPRGSIARPDLLRAIKKCAEKLETDVYHAEEVVDAHKD